MRKARKEPQTISDIISSGADYGDRVLYLTGELDFEAAAKIMVILAKMDETKGLIRIVLMSNGGSEAAGWAIYDAMRQTRNQIVIDVYGSCFSMAVAVLQAGFVRRMSKEARLMVHAGTATLEDNVDQRTIMAVGAETVKTNLRYAQILAERTGRPIEAIEDEINKETYFSAEEAKAAGYIDALIPYETPKKRRKRT